MPISCVRWFQWQGWTGVITFILAERESPCPNVVRAVDDVRQVILQLRLYALYFGNKRVLALMTFVSLSAAAGAAYVMGSALTHITGAPLLMLTAL